MQPSQNPNDRMLTALVLHTVSTILGKKDDPLLLPFVAILTNPRALKVSVYKMYITYQVVSDGCSLTVKKVTIIS